MKRVLIISPYFPPINAADMQRVRMSLPYFKENGWEAEVVTVNAGYTDMVTDSDFQVPKGVKVHEVKAFSKKITGKVGLGSIALRSMYFYKKEVDKLLKNSHFDLIYFSTTQFPLLILGAYWKKRHHIPYIIDMQDPWHSTYYEDKPKEERPPKYWFSYNLNKLLEPIAMDSVDGLISVSQAYIDTLVERYPRLTSIPAEVITFGAFKPDFEFVKSRLANYSPTYQKEVGCINFVYVGRGGHDMRDALTLLFEGFKFGMEVNPILFSNIRFHFIGTSYAPPGQGIPTIKPIADELGIGDFVKEQTDRISFFQSIYTLLTADRLMVLGSNDPQYTASKIYPYILAEKPLLSFFHPESSAAKIIQKCIGGPVISLTTNRKEAINAVYSYLLHSLTTASKTPTINWEVFDDYSAENMTKNQCNLFNRVLQ